MYKKVVVTVMEFENNGVPVESFSPKNIFDYETYEDAEKDLLKQGFEKNFIQIPGVEGAEHKQFKKSNGDHLTAIAMITLPPIENE